MSRSFPGAAAALRWSALVGYSALIFFSSHQADPTGGPPMFRGADKVLHLLAYALWGWTFSWALRGSRPGPRGGPGPGGCPGGGSCPGLSGWQRIGLATLAGALYGATDEFHQRFVPGREADLADLAADAAGAFLGASLHAAWRRFGPRRRVPEGSERPTE